MVGGWFLVGYLTLDKVSISKIKNDKGVFGLPNISFFWEFI